MKILIFVFSLLFISFNGFSQKYRFEQNFKLEELQQFKSVKVYIGLSDNEDMNNALRSAVENGWDFTEIEGEESIENIKQKVSSGKNIAYIAMVETSSSNLFSDKSGVNAESKTYALQVNLNGSRFGFYHQYLCYAEGFINNIDLSVNIGVKMLNSKLKAIDKENLKKSKLLKDYALTKSEAFATKTLYIPREWLVDISEEDFKSEYTYKVKFVDLEEYIEAIKNDQKDMIYVLPLAVPAEGGFVNTHVFTEADGHNYLGLCQKLTMLELQTNVFKKYSGEIEKKHIKLYDDTANGKW